LLSPRDYINFGRASIYGRGFEAYNPSKGMDRKKEILVKLQQIQEQAQLTLDELPLRLAKDRLRLIIGLARYLTTTVDVNWEAPVSAAPEGDGRRPLEAPPA
jgi:hypothetical protein